MPPQLDQCADVVSGTIEPDHLFPWVVDVAGTLTGKGVLIAPLWILTAAHLVETSFAGARVSYRRTAPVSGQASGGSQQTTTGSITLHPGYARGNPDHDLALVRLAAPFAPDPFLQPAVLPLAPVAVGQTVVVADVNHTAALPAGSLAVWRGPVILTGGTTFTARSPTASLCPGDSGSGVVIVTDAAAVVAGIAARAHAGGYRMPAMDVLAVEVFDHLDWVGATVGLVNAKTLGGR